MVIINSEKTIGKSINIVYTTDEWSWSYGGKTSKMGNSDGIRIPSSFLKSLNLKTMIKLNLYKRKIQLLFQNLKRSI